MMNKFIAPIKNACTLERNPKLLAISFCVGTYIAFSPFVGAHTIMAFVFSWLFKLNLPITLAASAGLNNPLTAIPIYLSDYLFGYWLLYKKLQVSQFHNPAWMNVFEQLCTSKLGITAPCIWAFLIGGNLLGLIVAIIAYPPTRYVLTIMVRKSVIAPGV